MPVRVRCPGCDSMYKLGDQLAGKMVRCKGCSQIFKVPGFAGVSVTETPAEKLAAKHAPAPQPADLDDEATLAGVVEDEQPPAPEIDEEPAAPKPRGKSKKTAAARKRKPVPMVPLLIAGGVLVLIGAGVGAWFFINGGSPAKTAQAPAQGKGASQPNAGGAVPLKGKGVGKGFKGGQEPDMEPVDSAKAGEPLPEKDISFVAHVKPFLNKYCIGCHGAKQPKAGISFASYDSLMRGGKKSGPIVFSGDADKSEIILVIEHKDDHRPMPPPKEKRQPTAEEKTMLRTWVSEGAKDDSTKTGALLLDEKWDRRLAGR
jgi:Planctomycete cytochrome C